MNRPVITQLRDFVPIRPLTRHEALSIAEHQALRLLELAAVHEPPVPERLITELPRLDVRRLSPFPTSGATDWVHGRWVVVLNGAEPVTRQRFSLAHELKHILDHPFAGQLYGAMDPRDRQSWIEQICDYFAGCLLVPRPWLKRAWAKESQHVGTLARRFRVSPAAMTTRLSQVGLVTSAARCGERTSLPPFGDAPRYWRASASRRTASLVVVGGPGA